jgi:hypothetical protein
MSCSSEGAQYFGWTYPPPEAWAKQGASRLSLPPTSARSLLGLLLNPEGEGDTIRNVGISELHSVTTQKTVLLLPNMQIHLSLSDIC